MNAWLESCYSIGLTLWIGLPFILIPTLLFIPAPYGKFSGATKLGFMMNGKLGWFIQEAVSPIVYGYTFYTVWKQTETTLCCTQLILLALWNIHYFNRTVIYTLRMPSMKPTAVAVVLSAIIFNIVNGLINGYAVANGKVSDYSEINVYLGIALFALGMYGNIDSDNRLMNLRKGRDSKQYYIPYGGLYEFVSCPNYFSEIVEWTGYALASSWSLAALGFVAMTIANLLPRAITTHKWYREHFKDKYPAGRKAIIPFIL